MKRKLNKIFIILPLIFLAKTAQAQELNKVLTETYNTNPQLQAAIANLKSSTENAPQALAEWLPSINADLFYGSEEVERGNSKSNGDTEEYQLELSQPIFNGGQSLARIKQAKFIIMGAQASLIDIEQTVMLEAITAYMDVFKDREILKLNKNNEQVLKKHLEVSKERFELGEITKTDVAQAEARLAVATTEKIIAEGALKTSVASFYKVTGNMPGKLSIPERNIDITGDIESFIQEALNRNPSVLIAKYNEMAAKQEINVTKAQLLPSISLDASKTKNEGVENLFGVNTTENTSVVFNFSIPLYQGGSEYSQIRQSIHDAEESNYSFKQTQNETKELITSVFQDLKVARATLISTRSAVEAATIALDGVEREAKVGSRTTLDVLDAEQELFVAKGNYITAKRDSIVNAYNLLKELGKLTAKSLELDVTYFDHDEYYNKNKYRIIGF